MCVCVSWASWELEGGWQKPAPERLVGLGEASRWVCGAERSHPPAPAASGAAWIGVSEPTAPSSAARSATQIHPIGGEEEKDSLVLRHCSSTAKCKVLKSMML